MENAETILAIIKGEVAAAHKGNAYIENAADGQKLMNHLLWLASGGAQGCQNQYLTEMYE